jgi:hypothetical protein
MFNSAKADVTGVGGSIHLPLPSMTRLNQTESTFFSLTCLASDSGFHVFQK